MMLAVVIPAVLVSGILAGTAGMRARRHARAFRVGFAGAQAALTAVLAVGAGSLVQSYAKLITRDVGYDRDARYVSVRYPSDQSAASRGEDVQQTLAALKQISGVQASGAIAGSIVTDGEARRAVSINGQRLLSDTYRVTPGFFDAAGMRILSGRQLQPSDDHWAGIVVNMAFVEAHWPGSTGLGKLIGFSGTTVPATVVGIVSNTLVNGLAAPAAPTIYGIIDFADLGPGIQYVLKQTAGTRSDPETIRRAIAAINRSALIGPVESIGGRLAESVGDRTFATLVLSLFAAAGTTVAGAGMVTIVAFVVARQTREFAIRIALGATHSNILRLAASEAMIGALLGGAGGLLLGRWLSGWLRSLVFGIEPGNWTTALTSSGLSFLIMAVAAVIAARRTLRLEPARALSME
jgi:hypothetical protein